MSASRICPRCGAKLASDSTEGLCPRCLLQELFEPAPETDRLVSVPEPAPGTRTRDFGDYELLEELGHGGMGVVFKARQLSLNRVVALKLIQGGEFANPRFVQRFHTEAEAAARLKHPHIVAIHEVGEHAGQQYFSMDHIEGQTLEELVRKGPLAPERAARLVQTVARAIHYAHGQGVLHRDLKPSNIIVDPFDQPHVTDFGLAKILTGSSALTLSDQPLGSPGYMSPEQAAGKPTEVGPHSDVYALGAVLYYLLTGRAPFHAETLTALLRQVRETDPVAPRVLNPSVPRDLETISLKCLEKEPRRRYESAGDVADELGRFLEDKTIFARPVSRPEKLWRWCRRQPTLASLAAALILAFIFGFAGVTWQWQEAEGARQEAEAAREHGERLLYCSDMNSAFQAIEDYDLQEAHRYLTNHWPKTGEQDLRSWEWRYLWQRCQSQELLTMGRHDGAANALAFSPDGKWLASGGGSGLVKIWDLVSTQQVNCITNGGWILALAFSPNANRLAVGWGQGIKVWDTRSWQEEDAVVITNGVRVESLCFTPDGRRLIGVNDADFGIWKVEGEPEELNPLERQVSYGPGQWACALSSDGRFLAHARTTWAGGSRAALLRDLESEAALTIRESKTVAVRTLALSPDDRWLAVAPVIGRLEVYGFHDPPGLGQAPTESHILDTKEVFALAFSPDGKLLAAGGINGRIELWETATWRRLQTSLGHFNGITDIAFSPDTNAPVLVTTSMDGTVRLWSTSLWEPEDLLPLDAAPLGWDPNWETAIHIDREEGTYTLWDFATQSIRARNPLPYAITNLAVVNFAANIGPRGKLLAFPLMDQSIRLWDPAGNGGKGVERWNIPTEGLLDMLFLHFSSDGSLLLGFEEGGEMWVWDVEGRREIASATTSWGCWPYQAQFTADQQRLAIPYGREGEVCLWDFAGSGQIIRFEGRHPGCQNLALSPDGSTLATVSWGGTLKLWDVAACKEILEVEGRGFPLFAVTFSPDGQRVLTGSDDELKVWDVRTGREVCDLRGDPPGAWFLHFQDSDTLLACTPKGLRRLHAPSFAEIEASVQGRR